MSKLDNPQDIWKNEYENRIGRVDRVFLNILYSLTDTGIRNKILKECFNYRLKRIEGLDSTINHYEKTLKRLNGSMVHIVDRNSEKYIAVINPSVNDYLKTVFSSNLNEMDNIRESIIYYEQILRCYGESDCKKELTNRLENASILSLKFFSIQKLRYIISEICANSFLHKDYTNIIKEFIKREEDLSDFVFGFLEEPVYSFYKINKMIYEVNIIGKMMCSLNLEELISAINTIYPLLNEDIGIEKYNILFKELIEEVIECYPEEADIEDYIDAGDISQVLANNTNIMDIDEQNACNDLKEIITGSMENEIDDFLMDLKVDLDIDYSFEVSDYDVEDIINGFLDAGL